jgi:Tfp pilus assembly protein PilF
MNRLDVLKNMRTKDPGDSFTRYAIALEYIGVNDNNNAGKELSELIEDDPGYLAAYYQFGKLLEESGEIEKAQAVYSKGMEIAKNQNDLHTFNELQEALENL